MKGKQNKNSPAFNDSQLFLCVFNMSSPKKLRLHASAVRISTFRSGECDSLLF